MLDMLATFAPSVREWLWLTAALFGCGLYGMLTRRNAVGILLALELCLNAAAVQFVVFNRYVAPGKIDGQVMAIFVIAVAAAEVVVALAILVALFGHSRTVEVTALDQLHPRQASPAAPPTPSPLDHTHA